MLKEFCAENFTLIPKAIKNGAGRIELCDNLAVGGTTVSIGVLEATLAYAHDYEIPVNAILRPRGGDFVYNDTELKIMGTDLLEFKKSGVDGIVVGCLTPENDIDEEAMEELLTLAEGLSVTFHMAFDEIPESKQFAAIDWLAQHGVDRILTHGGSMTHPITENLPRLQELMAYAEDKLIILPGGGINKDNAQEVAQAINAKELHGTKIV